MERGRKRTPTKLKVLKGTFRNDRAVKNEMVLDDINKIPEPPAILDDVGTAEWNRICKMLIQKGMLVEVDMTILAMYCNEVSIYFSCRKTVNEKGFVYPIKDEKGNVKYLQQLPHVGIGNKSLSNAVNIATLFGVTPSARTKISVGGTREEEPSKVKLLKLMKG